MFRFDCDVSHQGVGDQPRPPRSVTHGFCELLLFEHVAAPAIYWSATGGYAFRFRPGCKNQMSD
jgi:hypothetical protein